MARKKCPRCKGPIPSAQHEGEFPGALSRLDNETEICSSCGVAEAWFNLKHPGEPLPPINKGVVVE